MNRLKVAIVSESFFPAVNGVTNTVRHCADRLLATGHEVLLVAPAPGLAHYRGAPVVRVRSFGLPGYRTFSVGLPSGAVGEALAGFAPDVVHLASPFGLGYVGLRAARRLGVPTVAVYQTDVAGFARQYGVPGDRLLDRWVGHLHRQADRNLAPSTSSATRLRSLGVDDVHLWRRGVDLSLFGPVHRNDALHAKWSRRSSGDPRLVVGYVGRLAAEKEVHRLEQAARVPGVRIVVVGDGPERARLQRALPDATFTGMLAGPDLASAFASLDVFVHTGTHETFCQTVQEAQASGVAVVAPAAGGPLDLVRHGVTGLLYDPDDPGSLRRTLAALGGDPDLRARLAAAGHREVQGRTWERVVDELVTRHYPAVLRARGAARGRAA